MGKLTEVVEVSTSAVHPKDINPADAVTEFKRVCSDRGLTVDGEPEAVLTTFVVGQSARFSVSAECKPGAKAAVPKTEAKEV